MQVVWIHNVHPLVWAPLQTFGNGVSPVRGHRHCKLVSRQREVSHSTWCFIAHLVLLSSLIEARLFFLSPLAKACLICGTPSVCPLDFSSWGRRADAALPRSVSLTFHIFKGSKVGKSNGAFACADLPRLRRLSLGVDRGEVTSNESCVWVFRHFTALCSLLADVNQFAPLPTAGYCRTSARTFAPPHLRTARRGAEARN